MKLRTSLSLVALSAVAFACSSSDGTHADDGSSDEAESEVRACSPTYARKWFVSMRAGSCHDVPGDKGTWVASPLAADMPDSFCTMEWQGEKYSRADIDALRAFVGPYMTNAMTPACSGAVSNVGSLTEIPHLDNVILAGANGCDVCGILRHDGSMVVILPPERTALKEFEVSLTDGTQRSFKIEAPDGARALSLQLPAAPAGVQYQPGRVAIE